MAQIGNFTCSYPRECIRAGFPVVRKVSSKAHNTDPASAAAATSLDHYYSYEDPVTDLRGRGFLGFGTMRTWEPAQPKETVTTYAHSKMTSDQKYYPEVDVPATVTTAVPIVTATKSGTTTETARVTRTVYTYDARKTNAVADGHGGLAGVRTATDDHILLRRRAPHRGPGRTRRPRTGGADCTKPQRVTGKSDRPLTVRRAGGWLCTPGRTGPAHGATAGEAVCDSECSDHLSTGHTGGGGGPPAPGNAGCWRRCWSMPGGRSR